MKQIRFLTISIACLMLLASPSFGAKSRKFIVKNHNALDAYCAYAYLNTDRGTLEYHVDGWERIPSGTAVTINYTSKYQNLHICLILENGVLWADPSPTEILKFNVSKELETSFKVVYEIQGAKIGNIAYNYTSVDKNDLKVQKFYEVDVKNKIPIRTIPGTKNIKDQLPIDNRPGRSNPIRKPPPETDPFNGNYEREGQDYAILFATNEYTHKNAWHDLAHPISGAKQIRTALQKYGFTVELYPNVTTKDIGNVLKKWAKRVYAPDDQLLVYFTGHGHYDNLDGYLAAKDSEHPQLDAGYTTYYSYHRLKEQLDAIPCPNILLMVDACHSGNISSEVQKKLGEYRSLPDLYRGPNKQRRIKETVNAKTRWFLTAVGNEESPADSIFAKAFLKSLEDTLSGNSDKDNVLINDKILTIQEIEAMFRNMLDKQNLKFSPTTGAFGDNKDDRGFLFIGP